MILCGMVWLFPSKEVGMDKATYDAIRAVLRPFFREGGSLENAIEAVRAAQLDVEDERREADEARRLGESA